IPEDIIKK
uniref:Cryptide TyPep-9 n=1 Tax=Tityus serrulatus TaxID=6887 RepID=CRY9_TITSE